jgi:hypothetical protein
MCKADTALVTFEWHDNETKPMLKLRGPEHECIAWESLNASMASRTVGDDEMESLVNPLQAVT